MTPQTSIIALGEYAAEISKVFESYGGYQSYIISSHVGDGDFTKKIENYKNAEVCESSVGDFSSFLSSVDKNVVFLCTGAESESGAALKILETIKDRDIKIFYFRKDPTSLSQVQKTQDKVCFNVLQEYTRSGLFERMYIFDCNELDAILGDVPILEYSNRLSQLVCFSYHMITVFEKSKMIVGNIVNYDDVARISTIGLTEIDAEKDKWFFSLKNEVEVCYYYAINDANLEKDTKLLSKIKNQINSRKNNEIKIMFGVYPTEYSENYVFCIKNSKVIQN